MYPTLTQGPMESPDLVPLTARLGANPFFTLVAMVQVRELAPTHVQRGEQDRNLQCQANLFPKVTEQGGFICSHFKSELGTRWRHTFRHSLLDTPWPPKGGRGWLFGTP